MGEYTPPFKITNEILLYVSSISEKIGRITAVSNLEAKPQLRKNNRIKSIHSSVEVKKVYLMVISAFSWHHRHSLFRS